MFHDALSKVGCCAETDLVGQMQQGFSSYVRPRQEKPKARGLEATDELLVG